MKCTRARNPEIGRALDERRQEIAATSEHELRPWLLAQHAHGGLEERLGPLLSGEPAEEQHDRLGNRAQRRLRRPGGLELDAIVDHAQLGRVEGKARAQDPRGVAADAHDAVGIAQRLALHGEDARIGPRARAIVFAGVHVAYERPIQLGVHRETRRIGHPVVRVHHVEMLLRHEVDDRPCVAFDLLVQAGTVATAECHPDSSEISRRIEIRAQGTLESELPHRAARHSRVDGELSSRHVLDAGSPALFVPESARQDQQHLDSARRERADDPAARRAEPARDSRRVFPAQHQDLQSAISASKAWARKSSPAFQACAKVPPGRWGASPSKTSER